MKLAPDIAAEIAQIYDRRLSPEEFDERLREARESLAAGEEEQIRELIEWFKRRYPTPKERLEYVRRKMREYEGR